MKGITFILGLLFLVSALKPCSDGPNFQDPQEDQVCATHSHQGDTNDTCAVACVCACCGTVMNYQESSVFELEINPEISTRTPFTFQSNYRFDFLSAIWQPPKLNG